MIFTINHENLIKFKLDILFMKIEILTTSTNYLICFIFIKKEKLSNKNIRNFIF